MASTQTTTSLSASLRTFYERRLLDRALPVLVHARFGQRRPIPQGEGKTINFRKFSVLSAATTALTEGVTPAPESVTVSAITATLAEYGSFIRYTDFVNLTAIDPLLDEFAKLLGEQAGDTIDQLVRDVIHAGAGTTRYADGAANRAALTPSNVLDNAEIVRAIASLKAAKARPFDDGNFVCIISTNTEYDLKMDAAIVNAFQFAGDRGGDNPLFRGELGTYMGCRFFVSHNAKTYSGTACSTVEASVFLGRDAYGICGLAGYEPDYDVEGGTGNSPMPVELIVHPKGTGGPDNPLELVGTIAWKAPHVAKVLQSSWIYVVEHGSTLGG